MKPCKKNRKLIAWLAVDALDVEQARELRSHVRTCPGCLEYWQEMLSIAQDHLATSTTLPVMPGSDSFHEKLDRKILTDRARLFPASGMELLRRCLSDWRTLAVTGAVALVLVIVSRAPNRQGDVPQREPFSPIVSIVDDLEPTLNRYWIAANTSLETLNQLLAEQEARRSFPTEIANRSTINIIE